VRARGVARTGGSTSCIYVLDNSAARAFQLNGAFNISLACGMIVDSSSSSAMYLNGAVNWSGPADVVGGVYQSGAFNWSNPSGGPRTGATAQSDPLSYLAPPTYANVCNHTNFLMTNAYNTTINPGVYCGGINLSGAGIIRFAAGTYILLGGGLQVNGATVISGTDVAFYNTQGTIGGTTYNYGPIVINGASNTSLTAPTTGPMAGILFFQDRNITNPPASTIAGAINANFVGSLYFPTSALTFAGASNNQYTIIVSKTLTFSGAANINNNYSSLPGGSPVKSSAVMAE
jgi:hypothetical protein